MASRFPSSTLHQRDSRSDLFKGYSGGPSSSSRTASPSTFNSQQRGGGYGYGGYTSSNNGSSSLGIGEGSSNGNYRSATPNRKGQYSDAVLNELESQNDAQVDGILGKVRILKDMTVAIGDEIRDSSALAEKMNEGFDNTRLRLRGTMNRMMVMAERTGVGWRVWLGFFAAVIILFVWVWLF
ncbi:hypothetical protein QBC40DRAFT_285287 [Triangularia verruculosa]|uniref:t-SNARE coiled-coil homology domain-containing protein n=1 Tax=Triangularia verruculosa TaxID=2587418 RepID=A0AAN7ASD9_9PEZI|nr:hypothetical protein QBC40DRAFT_285287 [Triangularia verruculosa]